MVTEKDIAEWCLSIYPGQPPRQWDHLELPDDGIAFGIKDFGTATALWSPARHLKINWAGPCRAVVHSKIV